MAMAARMAEGIDALPLDRIDVSNPDLFHDDTVGAYFARLRTLDLVKPPGAAEAIDWARALAVLGADAASGVPAEETLGWVVKNPDDLHRAAAALGA